MGSAFEVCRAALARSILPDFLDVREQKRIDFHGGRLDHWEMKALVSEPNSIEGIADLLNQRIASNTLYKGSGDVESVGRKTNPPAIGIHRR